MVRKSNVQKEIEQQERQEIKYNKLIGRQDNEFVFLDYVFDHKNEFKGATGTRLSPVSQEEYDRRTDPDNIKESYEDIWRDMVSARKTDEGLEEWVQTAIRVDGEESMAFDTSYWRSKMWDDIREKVPEMTEEDYPVFEATGGGRCFSYDDRWDELYEPELWKLIQQYETHPKRKK